MVVFVVKLGDAWQPTVLDETFLHALKINSARTTSSIL
jgi:hypothetical protein